MPLGSGPRASWSSRADPLFATRDAASCEAPILSPTTSPRSAFGAPAFLAVADLRTRSESLISFLQLHVHTWAATRRPLDGGAGDWKSVNPARSSRPRNCSRWVVRDSATSEVMTRLHRQVGERLLHRLHAATGARLHDRVDLLDLRLPDQVADGVVGHEDLQRRGAAAPVGSRDEVLRDDSLERRGELHAHLLLLLGGERVDDAVDRLRRALGVKRGEDEVARLGGGQRGPDRLEVAHLADEDHVRVLAERRAEALGERRRVLADLALVDDAAPVLVEELDRILDGQDVLRARPVDPVDQRGERRRLAGAGGAGDEHEAARLLAELVEALRHCELLERLDPRRDHPERGPEAHPLVVGVDAEARDARERVGEVELALGLEQLLLFGRQDPVDERPDVVQLEVVRVRKALELAVDTNHRRRAGRQVKVGSIALGHGGQERIDREGCVRHGHLRCRHQAASA